MNGVINTQSPYVDEKGVIIKPKDNKRILIFAGIVIGIILLLVIIVIIANNAAKAKACNNIESLISEAAVNYARDNEALPTLVTGPVSYTADELINNGYLSSVDYKYKNDSCNGGVTITSVDGEPFTTVNVTDCGECSSDKRYGSNWTDESDKLNKKKRIAEVVTYYNYVTKDSYATAWTKYLTPTVLETKPIVNFNDKRLNVIPNEAKNIELDHEDLTYYRNRSKQWKFYKYDVKGYSALSSKQPAGYTNKDDSTQVETEFTEWSLDAPSVEPGYRTIQKQVGYRWYLEDENKNKIYWNSGAYTPENPDTEDETYIKDKKDSATVWRYKDRMWRWYSGSRRDYGSYMIAPNKYYIYRDNEVTKYTGWSSFAPGSKKTEANSYYLEEQSEVRTRYRVKYDLYSFNKLDNSVLLENFESASGMSIKDVDESNDYVLVTTYKYKYRKK